MPLQPDPHRLRDYWSDPGCRPMSRCSPTEPVHFFYVALGCLRLFSCRSCCSVTDILSSLRFSAPTSRPRKISKMERQLPELDTSAGPVQHGDYLDWNSAERAVGDAGYLHPTESWPLSGALEGLAHVTLADGPRVCQFDISGGGMPAVSGGPVSAPSILEEYPLVDDDGYTLSSFGGNLSLARASATQPGSSRYPSGGLGGPTFADPGLLAADLDGALSAFPAAASALPLQMDPFSCSSSLGGARESRPYPDNPDLGPYLSEAHQRPSSSSMTRCLSSYSVHNDFAFPNAVQHAGARMEFSVSGSGYSDAVEMSRISSAMASSLSSESFSPRQLVSAPSGGAGDLAECLIGDPVDPLSLQDLSQDRVCPWPEPLGELNHGLRGRCSTGLAIDTTRILPQSTPRAMSHGWHRSPQLAVDTLDPSHIRPADGPMSRNVRPDADDVQALSPINGSASRRPSEDLDLGAVRNHEWYQRPVGKDGLYHCPLEGQEGCNHRPETLKCNYHKHIDSHLKPYRCKVRSCSKQQFSSTACLLRHEREAHGMHGHGDKPFSCPHKGCDRSEPGNGFPRKWNLADHKRRVHDRENQTPTTATSAAMSRGTGSTDGQQGSKRKGAVVKRPKSRRNSKNVTIARPAAGSKATTTTTPVEPEEAGHSFSMGSAPQRLERASFLDAAPAMRATQSLQGEGHGAYTVENMRGSGAHNGLAPRSEMLHCDSSGNGYGGGPSFGVSFAMDRTYRPDTRGFQQGAFRRHRSYPNRWDAVADQVCRKRLDSDTTAFGRDF